MGILQQQIMMSKSAVNGRSVAGQATAGWVTRNLTPSQLRYSERDSDLWSGYFGGGENLGGGRAESMYPDNRTTIGGGQVVSQGPDGYEDIRDSRTPGLLG